jgi:uncharacterized membrane protein YcaP (DUF421 family)
MTDLLKELLGEKDPTVLQMCFRAVCVFFIGLILIRISGRRSFGMHMPLDNVITILMGAILSHAVLGDSSFFGTVGAATTLAVLHRLCAWIAIYNDSFGKLIKGTALTIFKDGEFIKENMDHGMVSKKDAIECVRLNVNEDSLENVKTITIERNGQISVVQNSDK